MKLPIVLDTCTILNLLRIDEDDEFLYKKLIKLNINICQKVFEEANKNINTKHFSNSQKKYISSHIPYFGTYILTCDERFESEYKAKIKQFCNYKKENGEFYSALISLYLCRDKNCRLYFYTDDHPAKNIFDSYFSYQQIGVIGDTIDLLVFLCWSNSDFKQHMLEKYLQNLLSEFAIPFKNFKDQFLKMKKEWIARDVKNKRLYEELNKIEEGIEKLDFETIGIGIDYFKKDSKSYKEINAFLDSYSDINLSGYMALKIKKTIISLRKHSIYKMSC
ncbi:hypothetical protein [Coprobacter secundus]|uniref:hypothetical protein n=1 Tax=Coprobacter secundus TaxID=1501392 RepID=UPI0005744B96|nr:hypothetical protein PU94_15340 [Coprobacter secundus]